MLGREGRFRRGISVPFQQAAASCCGSPKTHEKRSLREIAAELARFGHLAPSGKPYEAMSVKRMLER
jgi:hypothetical protein